MDVRRYLEEQCVLFAAAGLVNMKRSRTDAQPTIVKRLKKKHKVRRSSKRRILGSVRDELAAETLIDMKRGIKRRRREDTPSSNKKKTPRWGKPSTNVGSCSIYSVEPELPMLPLDILAWKAATNI